MMFLPKNRYLNKRTLLLGSQKRLKRYFCLFLAFCLLLLSLTVAQAQVTEKWVARYNGPGNGDDAAKALTVDGSGNIYVAGVSYGSGIEDYATIKYDPDGNELWVARYNGPGNSVDFAKVSSGVFASLSSLLRKPLLLHLAIVICVLDTPVGRGV